MTKREPYYIEMSRIMTRNRVFDAVAALIAREPDLYRRAAPEVAERVLQSIRIIGVDAGELRAYVDDWFALERGDRQKSKHVSDKGTSKRAKTG